MRSFRLTKWLSVIMCLVLAACFPIVPGAGRNAAKAENGEKHWYTFSVLPWGIVSSTNVDYLALYGPYRISEEDAAVIGRVKGMAKEVNERPGGAADLVRVTEPFYRRVPSFGFHTA